VLGRKGLLTFSNSICSIVFGFVVTYFVARALGPERYGILGFAIAFTGTLTAFGELGFTSAHLKLIAENKDFGKYVGTFFSIRIALNILLVAVALSTIYFMKKFNNGFETKTHEVVVYIFLASLVFKNIVSVITITFDGKLQTAKSQVVEFVSMLTNAGLSIFIAIILPNVILLASASLVAASVALVVAFCLFKGYHIEPPDADSIKTYVYFAAPLAVISILSPLYYYIDTLLIQFFNSSKDVGYYYGAQKLPLFVLLISGSLLSILLAAASQLHSQGNIVSLRELCKKVERYLSLIVSPIVVFLIIFAHPVIRILLGDEYIFSAPIMQLLLIRAFFFTIGRPASVLLVAMGRTKLYAILEIVLFPILVACYLILIPNKFLGFKMAGLGPQGAALSLMILSIISVSTAKIIVFKLSGIQLNARIFFHSLVAFFSCIIISWAAKIFRLNNIFFIPLFFVIVCSMYLVILWLTKQINKKDVDLFARMLNIKAMKNYLMNELSI